MIKATLNGFLNRTNPRYQSFLYTTFNLPSGRIFLAPGRIKAKKKLEQVGIMLKIDFTKEKLSLILTALLLWLLLANGSTLLFYHQVYSGLHRQIAELQSRNTTLNAELTQVSAELAELREKYDLLTQEAERQQELEREELAGGGSPTAYLTIDDGPSEVTFRILDILAEYDIKATFFVIGNNRSGDENIYRRIVEEGHTLGNHTFTHNLSTIYRSADSYMQDLQRLEDHLYAQTGMRTGILRFPGGSSNTIAGSSLMRELIDRIREQGYDYFDWNVYPGDSDHSLPPHQLIGNALTQVDRLQGGDAVILLHDTHINQNTAEALPHIIEGLQARGYTFARLGKGAIDVKHR